MIRKSLLLASVSLSLASFLPAQDWMEEIVHYEAGGTTFESTIVFQSGGNALKPGILMVPNWMGPTEASLEKAMRVAGDDYVVMMVDMYGVDVRPANAEEAGKAAGEVRADRKLMRERAATALAVFRAQAATVGMDPESVAAIGFCFGGGTVLELGRAGADLDAIVSFHGDLVSPTLAADAGNTVASVLVLHGADDPYVPQGDVQEFIEVMRATSVDWQLVQFSGTVHSFTNPHANSPGQSAYNPVASSRAFEMMEELLEEVWEGSESGDE